MQRGTYTEKLVIEIFGEYIFERDLEQAGYKTINACKLAIPPHARSLFFRLVNPLGRRNYARLFNWLFEDLVMLKVNKANIKKFDRFTEEQLLLTLAEYLPTDEEIKEFKIVALQLPVVTVGKWDTLDCNVACQLAILDNSISMAQLEWLHARQFPIKHTSKQLNFE